MLGNIFKNKAPKEKITLGLDIGTSALKYVKLKFIPPQAKGGQEKIELCGLGIEPGQLDIAALVKKIAQDTGAETVNISASGHSTVIRYVLFPKMTPDELKQALKFEAQKNIPFTISETNFDGVILKDDLPANKMLVLIAAAKKDFISSRIKLIDEAQLSVGMIDIDSLAVINAFNFNYPQAVTAEHKAVALVNIGAAATNLSIVDQGTPRLSRDVNIAGNAFTQKIADSLGKDSKACESIKINPDAESAKSIATIQESILSGLVNEMRVSFDFYESQSASTVNKIFLSGGSSRLPGCKGSLANALGIEVEEWDVFKGVTLAEGIDVQMVKSLSPQMAVAFGLALR